jgi:LEA14-like dessication related protein
MNTMRWSMTAGIVMALGCASQPKQVETVEDVAVRVDRILPQADSLDASKIGVKLQLANPRGASVSITQIDYKVDTGDIGGVLNGQVAGGTVLESQQITEVEFSQKIPFPEDKERYRAVLDEGQILLTVSGNVQFDDGTSATFEKKGAVATPSLPKFVLHDAQAARYGKDGLDVTLYLRLINENVFTVTIDSLEYQVAINGKETKSEQGAIGARLVQGAAQEFAVSIVMDEKAFPNIKEILASGEIEYTVGGNVAVASLQLPIDISGKIEFSTDSPE